MDPQSWIIAGLSFALVICFLKLRTAAEQDREWYASKCQQDVMAIKVQFDKAIEADKYIVSAKIAELSVQMSETKRLWDERERARERRIADMELVLKTRLRFQP